MTINFSFVFYAIYRNDQHVQFEDMYIFVWNKDYLQLLKWKMNKGSDYFLKLTILVKIFYFLPKWNIYIL